MAYASNDIQSLSFLAANVIYQATQGLLNATDESDSDILDDAALMMDVISSYHTENDPTFRSEWSRIQEERKKAKWAPGEDRATDTGFRWRELKAMFRSLCRAGVFVRNAAPTATWNPTVPEVSA